VVFLARWDGIAVGVVALRCHRDGTAELKRMYVRPVARGRGAADLLVGAVVEAAAARGCHTIWLETVHGAMDRAIAVYRRHGFVVAVARSATLGMDGVVVMERPLLAASACS
jgi:GNAT superfamily N-acetyltransferase